MYVAQVPVSLSKTRKVPQVGVTCTLYCTEHWRITELRV
jgi:hypothetical protein